MCDINLLSLKKIKQGDLFDDRQFLEGRQPHRSFKMKKFIKLLGLLVVTILMFGCASTKGADKTYPDELIPPQMEKKLVGDNMPNPLNSTNVKGIYVIHPHENMKNMMNSGYNYEIEILDKKTGEILYILKDVIIHWTGMYGWNGQVVEKDLTCITEDYLQYVIKESKFSWNVIVEDGLVNAAMDNPLVETDLPSVFLIKPATTKYTRNLSTNDSNTYKIEVIEKATNKSVKVFDNVVTDWIGINGWDGKIVGDDYTFITKDRKQYIVKADKYSLKYEISFINPTEEDVDILDFRNQIITTVKAGTTGSVMLNKWEKCHWFMEGKRRIDVTIRNSYDNFILKFEKPEVGKKYLCLSQSHTTEIEKSMGDASIMLLFEVVNETDENAYKYSDGIYVCNYPSAYYFIMDSEFVKETMGKEIVYSEDFMGDYTYDGYYWGWDTFINNRPYHHTTQIFTLKK